MWRFPSMPKIGPTHSRLHRYEMSLRIVHILCCFFIISGLSLWISCVIPVILSVTFLGFQNSAAQSIWGSIWGFGVLTLYLVRFGKSIAKTAIRQISWIWSDETPAFNLIYGIFYSTSKALLDVFFKKSPDEEDSKETYYLLSNILMLLFFVITIGAPILSVSAIYGYWTIVQFLTAGISILSSVFILSLNFGKRIKKAYRVLSSLQSFPEQDVEYVLRSSYMASMHFDNGNTVFQSGNTMLFKVGFWLVIGHLFFEITDKNTSNLYLILGGCALAASAILFLPPVMSRLNKLVDDTYTEDEKSRNFYNGKTRIPALMLLFSRLIMLVVGFASLLYFEDKLIFGQLGLSNILNQKIGFLSAFLVLVLARDLLFLAPTKWIGFRTRFGGFFLCHALQIVFSVLSRAKFQSFSTGLALLITYLNIDYRHPRFVWNNSEPPRSVFAKSEKYGIKFLNHILRMLGIIFVLSLVLGIVKGSSQTLANDVPFELPKSSFTPSVCLFNLEGLNIREYAQFAQLAYQRDPIEALSNSTLSRFVLGNSDQNPEYLSTFQEFVSKTSNLTILSIRGTKSLNDAFYDMYVFSAPLLLESSSYFGTLVNIWPTPVVAKVVSFINNIGKAKGLGLSYADSVVERVKLLNSQGRKVVVVGHSLGGAMAGIVSAKLGISAVGFSSPGLGYQSDLYDFS
jgi:hypothetical protein